MKEVFTFIGFIIVVVLVGTLVFSDVHEAGYKEGYKQGQIDAMKGIYKYKADTVKKVNYISISIK
jgi:hypothetical protein